MLVPYSTDAPIYHYPIIQSGQPELAYRAHRKMRHSVDGWQLPDDDFLQLILCFHTQEKWHESLEPLVEYVHGGRQRERQVRLKLAHILIEYERRPSQALRVLSKLPRHELNENQQRLFKRLVLQAKALADDDPYEITNDW